MTEVRGGEGTRGPCHRAEIARVVLTRDETTAARDPHLRGEGERRLLLHIPPPSPSSSAERIHVGGGGSVVAVVIATVGDQWCLRVDEERWWRAVIDVALGRVVRIIVVVFVIIGVVFFINWWPLQLYNGILLFLAGRREQRGTDSVFPSS